MQNKLHQSSPIRLNQISYIKFGSMIVSRWYWLAIAIVLSFTAGSVFLYLSPPIYSASASFKIEEKRSELSELISVRNVYEKNNKTESERFILKSRNVLLKAYRSLNSEVLFFEPKKFSHSNLYPLKPLPIQIVQRNRSQNQEFEFRRIDHQSYELVYVRDGRKYANPYYFGQLVQIGESAFRIHRPTISSPKTAICFFSFVSDREIAKRIDQHLSIDESQAGNILNIEIRDQNPSLARDLVNAILDQYINFDKAQRTSAISQSEKYIDTLADNITVSSARSGKAVQRFKITHPSRISPGSLEQISTGLTNLEGQRQTLDIRIQLIKNFRDQLQTRTAGDSLSFGLQEVDDPQLTMMITKYNELIMKKNQLLTSYTTTSPTIRRLDQDLSQFKITLHNNIASQIKNCIYTRGLIKRRIDSAQTALLRFPAEELEFTDLQSKFEINKKIRDYLSEKKLEAQISKAAITPAVTVIDRAVLPVESIYPASGNVYIIFVCSGIGICSLLIISVRILNPFIYNKEAIQQFTQVPVIGVVRKYETKAHQHEIPVLSDLRSGFTESLRSVRANLAFLAAGQTHKIVCITSEISGEGKSFLALNLAVLLTLVNKKVLLIAADLRRSQLHLSLSISNNPGLSNYLCGQYPIAGIIKHTRIKNLDFIPSGSVPPNPAELLEGAPMNALLTSSKMKYDFIILDSAPVGLVTDGKALLSQADINLFIMRCGLSRTSFAESPDILQREFDLSNFAIVLNDFKESHFYDTLYRGRQAGPAYHYPSQIHTSYHREYFEA